MTVIIYIATSLDGFIATEDGGIDWLSDIPNPEQSDFGFANFMERIDALIMGRRTFEKVQSFGAWPYEKPVFVLSETLATLPENPKGDLHLISGKLESVLNQVSEKGHKTIYVDGGITIQGFLAEDLVDEMIITRIPILLGSGIPLFGRLGKPIPFSHERTEVLTSGLVKSYYVRSERR